MSSARHLDDDIIATLQDVMGGDFPLLVETFIKDSNERIGQLQKLIHLGDAEAIRRAAHSFKGSSSNLGAIQIAAVCNAIELEILAGEQNNLAVHLADIEAEFLQVVALLQDKL